MFNFKLSIYLIIICLSQVVLAWGSTGHRVVSEIAYKHLNPIAKKKVDKIFNGHSFTEASTWADEMRSNPKFNFLKPSHYTSIKDHHGYNQERSNDIVAMIKKLGLSIQRSDENQFSLKEQISLISHFVGDLHQPLHVGRAADRGGNMVRVFWFGKESNLHKVWDSGILDRMKLSFSEIVRFIDFPQNIKSDWGKSKSIEKSTIVAVNEALSLRALVYNFSQSYKPVSQLVSLKQTFKKYPHSNKLKHARKFKKK